MSLSIHRDAAAPWVLVFAVLAALGLLAALFVPRRRMWVKVGAASGTRCASSTPGSPAARIPTLDAAVDQFAQRHGDALEPLLREQLSASGSAPRSAETAPGSPPRPA